LASPTGHEKCGNVNPGKPDLLAGNILHYNFTLQLFTPCPLSAFNHNRLQGIRALTNSTPKILRTVLKNP